MSNSFSSLLSLALIIVALLCCSCTESPKLTVDESELQGVVRTSLDSPEPTAGQLDRRKRNTDLVAAMGLPTFAELPVVEDEAQVKPRTKEEVAKRCIAAAICAAKGEANDQELTDRLVADFKATSFFSPDELKFIKDKNPEQQDRVDFAWRYECIHVFLWALSFNDELQPNNEICDVKNDIGHIAGVKWEDFLAKAKLRSQSEILEQADLYYRLHWAAIDLRINGKTSDKCNEEIIAERHRALNWLIRYMGQDWDSVTTDT